MPSCGSGVCLSACLLIPAASVSTAAPPTSRPATRWACRDDSTGAKTGAQLSAVCCNASFLDHHHQSAISSLVNSCLPARPLRMHTPPSAPPGGGDWRVVGRGQLTVKPSQPSASRAERGVRSQQPGTQTRSSLSGRKSQART